MGREKSLVVALEAPLRAFVTQGPKTRELEKFGVEREICR
jgi:hypothetical protein